MTDVLNVALDSILDHPHQPRYSVSDVAALAESIEELGLLEPITLYGVDRADGSIDFRILAGHRRVAACRSLGHEQIAARIVPLAEETRQVQVLMATNTAREALTPVEEARGYQTMLDLGLDATAVAKATGRKRELVERTAKLAGAFSGDRLEQVVETPLTLEESEALARHADNEERFAKLLKNAGTPSFGGWASRFDDEVQREAVREKASAKLQAEQCKIVDGSYGGKQADLADLLDEDGKKLTRKAHASCPGHAACISQWATQGKDAITYVCTDWKKHGHRHRYLTERGTSAQEAENARKGREWRKRIKATLEDRRAWVKELLSRSLYKPPVMDSIDVFLLHAAQYRGFDLDAKGDALLFDWLGLELPEPKHEYDNCCKERKAAVAEFEDPMRAMLAMACAHGEEAVRLSKPPNESWWNEAHATAYLRFLEEMGYVLSDVEQELVEGKAEEDATDGGGD